jgi:hypothetical protein
VRSRFGSATAVIPLGLPLGLVAGPASATQCGTDRPLRQCSGVTTAHDRCTFPLSGTIEGWGTLSHFGSGTSALSFVITPGGSPSTPLQTWSGTFIVDIEIGARRVSPLDVP